MHSLNQEIKAFSRNNLRKQCTRVTTLTGKKIIETWKDARIHVVEEVEPNSEGDCGYVQDLSLDLQVGVIKPWLLLGSQDAAHDLDTLKKHKVTHILNVAYGVENAFLSDFTYKSISILDVPDTNILSYFPECFEFIEQAKMKQPLGSQIQCPVMWLFIQIQKQQEKHEFRVCLSTQWLPWGMNQLFPGRSGSCSL
ncbi:dual specificity protein phosphatase 19 isoform X2 [Choloepus didactylus]|uniref:dual specificity protein phosphatase 19 isoform X2 n=1 Tax=Choloepus didactylus TaxID=27675 RepID=UPI0018A04DF9|nr:dual specificity protein phosphatase 19 isoform X2 [Choloepus didactylus]